MAINLIQTVIASSARPRNFPNCVILSCLHKTVDNHKINNTDTVQKRDITLLSNDGQLIRKRILW